MERWHTVDNQPINILDTVYILQPNGLPSIKIEDFEAVLCTQKHLDWLAQMNIDSKIIQKAENA